MKFSKEQKDELTTLFAHNPEVEVLYITSDGQAFTESGKADSHCQRLKDEKVLTVVRDVFEAGEAPLETERSQEAGEGKMKTVQTIPSEVKDLEAGINKDAASSTADDVASTKKTLNENSENKKDAKVTAKAGAVAAVKEQKAEITAKVAEKLENSDDAEKTALQEKYIKVFGKKPNHLTGIEKLKTLIAEKEAKAGKTDSQEA